MRSVDQFANHLHETRMRSHGGCANHVHAQLVAMRAQLVVQVVNDFHVIGEEADRDDYD